MFAHYALTLSLAMADRSIDQAKSAKSTSLRSAPPAKVNLGAIYYRPIFLSLYDFWVLGLSNSYAWRCPTRTVLLPFFESNFSSHHIDIGVGTGFFPATALKSRQQHSLAENGVDDGSSSFKQLTLVDLNANSLSSAAKRVGRPDQTRCLVADAFQPLPLALVDGKPERFGSISLFYLLHCLRGPSSSKGKLFSNLKNNLEDDGVLFGATVLGKGDFKHNLFGMGLMLFYNGIGLFDNWKDTERDFVAALRENFNEVESKVVGCTLLFKASKPKR